MASGALRPASRPSERTGTLGPPSPQTRSRCVRPPRGAWLPGGAEPPGWRGPRQCARPGRAPHTPLAPRPSVSHTRLCPGRVCDATPHSGRRDPEGKAARAPRLAPRSNRVQEGDIWKARGRGTRLHRESRRPDPASSHGPGVRRRSVRSGRSRTCPAGQPWAAALTSVTRVPPVVSRGAATVSWDTHILPVPELRPGALSSQPPRLVTSSAAGWSHGDLGRDGMAHTPWGEGGHAAHRSTYDASRQENSLYEAGSGTNELLCAAGGHRAVVIRWAPPAHTSTPSAEQRT